MLELRGVRKTFNPGTPGEHVALRGIDLTVEDGAFVIVIGTNGAGKSTLLNAIAGTFPVDAGSIRLDGRDLTTWPEHRRATLIGRVWDSPVSGTAPTLTVADNLALATRRGRWHRLLPNITARLRDSLVAGLQELGLNFTDRLHTKVGSLTPMERQQLALVMATWRRPRLLILDDPTADLDPRSAEQVAALMEKLVARHGLTTLLVTHSLPRAVNLGNRLLMLHRGRIVHDFRGPEKRRLRVDDLLARFEMIRQGELLDESAGELLRRVYV
jgi:putative ABC transport system ATP-binding protein